MVFGESNCVARALLKMYWKFSACLNARDVSIVLSIFKIQHLCLIQDVDPYQNEEVDVLFGSSKFLFDFKSS